MQLRFLLGSQVIRAVHITRVLPVPSSPVTQCAYHLQEVPAQPYREIIDSGVTQQLE